MDQGNSVAFQRSRRIGRDVENSDQLTSSAGVSDAFPASVMSVATCEAGIDIDYAYCGVEPGTNATLLILGGAEAGKAANIFGQAAAVSGTI